MHEIPCFHLFCVGETSGMSLTFETRLPDAFNSNAKFENSTRIIMLIVALTIPMFAPVGLLADVKVGADR
jgi:hypothetical protein